MRSDWRLGARGDAGLVRNGQDKGSMDGKLHELPTQIIVRKLPFLQSTGHRSSKGTLSFVKRIQTAEGASRATINDQPVSLAVLRQFANRFWWSCMDNMPTVHLVNVNSHRKLYSTLMAALIQQVAVGQGRLGLTWSASQGQLCRTARRLHFRRAEVERDYLEHAVKGTQCRRSAPEAERRVGFGGKSDN